MGHVFSSRQNVRLIPRYSYYSHHESPRRPIPNCQARGIPLVRIPQVAVE